MQIRQKTLLQISLFETKKENIPKCLQTNVKLILQIAQAQLELDNFITNLFEFEFSILKFSSLTQQYLMYPKQRKLDSFSKT
jgi:hypothetical protein